MVLAGSTLCSSGSPCRVGLCQIEFNGRNPGGYSSGNDNTVDTSYSIFPVKSVGLQKEGILYLRIKAVFSFSYKQTLAIVPRPILVAASPCVP